MTGGHGPAARLAQIAHTQQAQFLAACAGRQLAQVSVQHRMAELAVPFGVHHHPARATQRQSQRALQTAGSWLTDGAWQARLGRRHATPAQIETSGRRLQRRCGIRRRRGHRQNQEGKQPKHQPPQSARFLPRSPEWLAFSTTEGTEATEVGQEKGGWTQCPPSSLSAPALCPLCPLW